MDDRERPGCGPARGPAPVPADAPGPWRVAGEPPAAPGGAVLYDATGDLIADGWTVVPSGLTGRTFSVSSPGNRWSARTVGLTVSRVVVAGPGGELGLNRRPGELGRDIVDVANRRLVARTRPRRDGVIVEIVGGDAAAAGVDPELLAAAAVACAHMDGRPRLMG